MIVTASISARSAQRAALWCLLTFLFVPHADAGTAHDIQVGRGWRFRVYADNLPKVDNVLVHKDGSVYATLAQGDNNGKVVRLRNGQVEVVAANLDTPRGLMVRKEKLFVTDRVEGGRLLEIDLKDNKRRVIENISNPEHIEKLPNGDLVVTENGVHGRLVRMTRKGAVEVVTAGLNDPEGLAVGHDGTIYIGENGTGRVLAFKDGEMDVVIDDLDELGQIETTPDGVLWITERGTPGRLLRLKDGALETVLNGLKDPRGVALAENGGVLVSEYGRARLLLVEPKPTDAKPTAEAKPAEGRSVIEAKPGAEAKPAVEPKP
jgi:DNA-binding beta-propeller fold protein YncE